MRDVVPPRRPGQPPAWLDLIDLGQPLAQPEQLGVEDAARLAAGDVDEDDLGDADWYAVAPMLSQWPREQP